MWGKDEFSASLLQSSKSHDPSEIILMCCSSNISYYYQSWKFSKTLGQIIALFTTTDFCVIIYIVSSCWSNYKLYHVLQSETYERWSREKWNSADKQAVHCISEVYPTDLRVVERTEERGWEKNTKWKRSTYLDVLPSPLAFISSRRWRRPGYLPVRERERKLKEKNTGKSFVGSFLLSINL